MSVADAAKRLGVTERRVRQLAANGELGAVRLGERGWILDAKAVAKYVRPPLGRRPRRP